MRNSGLPQSNQASGTAVVIRPNSYPPGVRGGSTKSEQLIIRDIIADTEGLIRWPGDDRPAYEGLFYLSAHPDDARLTRVAAKIRTWNETPGVGARIAADMTQPPANAAPRDTSDVRRLHIAEEADALTWAYA